MRVLKMPIVDGLGSIKMIRAFEKSEKCSKFSHLAQHQGHIPIFAISASLLERDRPKYIEAGFDGWILKPVDFKQLHVLLQGISDDMTRNDCLYAPGEWERGGWFSTRSILKDSTPTGPSVHNGDHSES